MKRWHFFALALTLSGGACGTKDQRIYGDAPGGSDGSDDDDDDDDDGDDDDAKDAGAPKGSGRDSGKAPPDDDDDDDKATSRPDARIIDDTCYKTPVTIQPIPTRFLIVLDRSASMIGLGGNGGLRWDPSVSAVKKLTSQLTDVIDFGLMMFPGPSTGGIFGPLDPAASCMPGTVQVAMDVENASAIGQAMDQSPPDFGQTPTAATMQAALEVLDTVETDGVAEAPTYVILITDGQPNCGSGGSETTAEDIAAVDAALDALLQVEIKTFVLGYDMASNPALAMNMEEFAQHGGTEHAYAVEDEQSLLAELTRIVGASVSCEVDLSGDDVEEIDPTYLRVEIDGMTYEYGSDWVLDGKKLVLTDGAAACAKLRDAKVHRVEVTRECTPLVGL